MGSIKEALTFDDVLILPRYSEILPVNTNISLNLSNNITLKELYERTNIVQYFYCVNIHDLSIREFSYNTDPNMKVLDAIYL